MLEQEYLELTNQLKEEFDKKDKEMEELKEKHFTLFKSLISVYGMIRMIDIADDEDKEPLLEILRGYLSDLVQPVLDIMLDPDRNSFI
jgi:hypothetical protein